jgi:hypothetical protein
VQLVAVARVLRKPAQVQRRRQQPVHYHVCVPGMRAQRAVVRPAA